MRITGPLPSSAGCPNAFFAALNQWLTTRCRELAARKHPATPERSTPDCFAQEQLALRRITASFDGYV